MRFKLLFWLVLFNVFCGVDTFAYELYNSEGNFFEDGSEIAGFNTYTVTNDVVDFELLILDEVSHQILRVYSSNSGAVEFMVPLSNPSIKIVVTDYNESGKLDYSSREVQSFKVGDYGYPVVESLEYGVDLYDAKFTLEENNLVFTKESNEALSIKYQLVDDEKSHDLTFVLDGMAKIEVAPGDIVQFVETVSGKELFYEIEVLENNYIVRSVSSFDFKQISVVDVIDWFGILWLVMLMITAVFVKVLMKREKKLLKKARKRRRSNAK